MVDPSSLPLFQTAPARIAALQERYAEPHRHYHTWAHIGQMLELYETVETKCAHREAVLYAIYYHDAIYKVPSTTNEEESADLFEAEASDHIDADTLTTAKRLIIATKVHAIPDGMPEGEVHDCQYFLDIDMSITGMESEAYREYAQKIRKEYAVIPDAMYAAGRIQILKSFLEKERIFLTDSFRQQYEEQARENVTAEIERLAA